MLEYGRKLRDRDLDLGVHCDGEMGVDCYGGGLEEEEQGGEDDDDDLAVLLGEGEEGDSLVDQRDQSPSHQTPNTV